MSGLLPVLAGFVDLDVLVIGDAVLDGWLSGPSERLSREAPVPVVGVTETVLAPGAAANTAANVAALGARVRLLSLVGNDPDGALLRSTLRAAQVPDDDLLVAPGRRTLAKRRVLAGTQMLTRVDEGDDGPVEPEVAGRLSERLRQLVPLADVVVVSDYGAGVCGPVLRDVLARCQAADPRLLVVDAREPVRWSTVGATAAKPNAGELCSLLPGTRLFDGPRSRPEAVEAHAAALLAAAGVDVLAATLDTDGAVILERGRPPHRVYCEPAPHSLAAGAGDSFTAAFALALGCGASVPEAGELAAYAAAVVVRRPGTAACTAGELRHEVTNRSTDGLLDLDALADAAAAYRRSGRRVVFTNGCFDVLHRGHVSYLNQAKELGDVLVVGVNSDASTARLKGPDRPVNPVEDRAAVLAGLSCVDHLVVFDGDTPADVLAVLRPDIYAKGGDYTAQMLSEAPLVERLGGQVRILDYLEDRSTSGILERVRSGHGSGPPPS